MKLIDRYVKFLMGDEPEPGSWAEWRAFTRAGHVLALVAAFSIPIILGLSFYYMFFGGVK